MPATKTAPKKKPVKKRKSVGVGDLVTFYSPISHMTGAMGEVVQVLDRDHVVVKSLGAEYDMYEGMYWVVLTYKPHGTTPDGESKERIYFWLRKVKYSRQQLPPKPPKRPKPVTVIEGVEGLKNALTSNEKHAAVHFVPDSGATP